jgi:hypothetical protein
MRHILKIDSNDIIEVNSLFMTASQRTSALDRFHVNLDSDKIKPENQHTARFIVATSSAIATGLTLAEGISVCFLEPDYNAHTMEQGWCRHCRQGNKNKLVHSWLCLNEGNKTEKRILDTNGLKEKIKQVAARKLAPGEPAAEVLSNTSVE